MIRTVDPVRDQLILSVYGTKPMKILYDERTQVYRDGVKTSLSDLRAKDHASVQTVLDGTKIFAVSIHMLSQAPQGECQGQVLSYDAGTGHIDRELLRSRANRSRCMFRPERQSLALDSSPFLRPARACKTW